MAATQSNRRKFLKQAALAVGAPMIVPSSVLGRNGQVAPSNRIVFGGIGLGRRGRLVLERFLKQPDVHFVTIADPQKERREIIKRLTDREYGNEDCTTTPEMFEVLGRDDIDAILTATGDRWHSLVAIYAAQAGKDIYSEKPCAMTIRECQELDEAILRYGRVYQAGTQRRNVDNFVLAAELARSGKLGNLQAVHAGIWGLRDNLPWLPAEPEPDPAETDWNRWLGPAPWRPYNKKYCQGAWYNHDGLCAGWGLLGWGSHTVDLCQWAAGADDTVPIEFENDGDTVYGRYANGVKLVMREAGFKDEGDWIPGLGSCPVRFEGDEGWVEVGDFYRIEVSDPKLLEGKTFEELAGTDPIKHVRNFLDCIKSREKPACHSTVTRKAHVACLAGAIGWKLNRKVKFDPATESFPDDAEANRLCARAHRAPWHV